MKSDSVGTTERTRGVSDATTSCTVSEILQIFLCSWVTPPLFHPNFGGVPVAPDRPCWGQRA